MMKISLITATFNSSSTLCDTIKSVLAQSYQEIEYIVVDGLSKDSTVDIIKEYEPYFKGRMKWISERIMDYMMLSIRESELRPVMLWEY